MKIVYPNTPIPLTRFKKLKSGDLFRDPKKGGLFLKVHEPVTDQVKVLVLDPLNSTRATPKGRFSEWPDNAVVIPVTKITIETESFT